MKKLSTTEICEVLNISYDRLRYLKRKYNISEIEKVFKKYAYEKYYNLYDFINVMKSENVFLITETYHIYPSKMNYDKTI